MFGCSAEIRQREQRKWHRGLAALPSTLLSRFITIPERPTLLPCAAIRQTKRIRRRAASRRGTEPRSTKSVALYKQIRPRLAQRAGHATKRKAFLALNIHLDKVGQRKSEVVERNGLNGYVTIIG